MSKPLLEAATGTTEKKKRRCIISFVLLLGGEKTGMIGSRTLHREWKIHHKLPEFKESAEVKSYNLPKDIQNFSFILF